MTTREPTAPSEILSIRIATDLKADLGRLAQATKRTKSILAAEAVEVYVARELDIVDGTERGLADMWAGRVVSHDQAAAEMRQMIDVAKSGTPEIS